MITVVVTVAIHCLSCRALSVHCSDTVRVATYCYRLLRERFVGAIGLSFSFLFLCSFCVPFSAWRSQPARVLAALELGRRSLRLLLPFVPSLLQVWMPPLSMRSITRVVDTADSIDTIGMIDLIDTIDTIRTLIETTRKSCVHGGRRNKGTIDR